MFERRPSGTLTTGGAFADIAFDIALLLFTFSLQRRSRDARKCYEKPSARTALAGLSLFFAWIILYFGTALVASILFPAFPTARPFHLLIAAPSRILLVLAVVNAVLEEIVVVGYVVSALSPGGAALSVGVSAVVRFVLHLYQGPLVAVSVVPVGLLFAAVYWRSRDIRPLVIAHALGSIIVFVMAGPISI
jgi:membrane protease YdiL (CAAX protease family)